MLKFTLSLELLPRLRNGSVEYSSTTSFVFVLAESSNFSHKIIKLEKIQRGLFLLFLLSYLLLPSPP